MSNKPRNVTRHDHFFVYMPDEIYDDVEKEHYRFDACECTNDGNKTYGVWDVKNDLWTPIANYEEACFIADRMAYNVRRTMGLPPF